MVVEIKKDRTQEAAYMLEEVEVSRALFELYEGGVVGTNTRSCPFGIQTTYMTISVYAPRRKLYREA